LKKRVCDFHVGLRLTFGVEAIIKFPLGLWSVRDASAHIGTTAEKTSNANGGWFCIRDVSRGGLVPQLEFLMPPPQQN
jgi:hypothetical protein